MRIILDDKVGKEHALNANEACVYAAIARYSNGMGWYANYEKLAQCLPFVISEKTVQRAVSKLIGLGLVEKRQNVLFARTNCPEKETNCPQTRDKLSENGGQIVLPPNNPLYKEINKEMERNNIIARDTIATPNPRTLFSFEEFLSLYQKKAGSCQFAAETVRNARGLWDAMPRYKQQALTQAVSNGTWLKPRLDWTLSDFPTPTPRDYNGCDLGREMLERGEAAIAFYNGQAGIYSNEDILLFNLQIKQRPA